MAKNNMNNDKLEDSKATGAGKGAGKSGSSARNHNGGRKSSKRRGGTKDVPFGDKLDSKGRDNDPNWYFLDSTVADQASSFSFDQYIGVPTTLTVNAKTGVNTEYTMPSILVANVNPSPGDTSSIQMGINVAAMSTYTTLSSQNAKTTQYAPQDLTILILAIGEVISILEHIRRAFGVAFTYNQRNRNMPTILLDSMGFSHEDFLNNLAQHRLEFNSWITALNKLPFLSNINYLFKCAEMYQNVYADSDSGMAQIMFMRPGTTWVLDEKYDDNGSGLSTRTTPAAGSNANWSEWRKLVNEMLEALMTSSTLNYIYSDIINYSQKNGAKLLYLDYLREDYVVVPTYNRNFSLQMHNAVAIGMPMTEATAPYTKFNDVHCSVDKNTIVYNPVWGPTQTLSTPVVDFDTPSASVVDRIEATRYVSGLKWAEGSDDESVYTAAFLPDHYITSFLMYDKSNDPSGLIYNSLVTLPNPTSTANMEEYLPLFSITQFDWNPLLYLYSTETKQISVLGDLNYYTTLDGEWFKRVNDLTFQDQYFRRTGCLR